VAHDVMVTGDGLRFFRRLKQWQSAGDGLSQATGVGEKRQRLRGLIGAKFYKETRCYRKRLLRTPL